MFFKTEILVSFPQDQETYRPDTSSLAAVRHVHIYYVWFNLSVLTKEMYITLNIYLPSVFFVTNKFNL